MSIYSDPDGWNDWMESRPKERKKRDTIYKKGETIRRYKHRTLHIYHPQTDEQWRKATHTRRSRAAKEGAKNRTVGFNSYADPFGLTDRQRRQQDWWLSQERKKEAARMGVEDMRALLKDEHWEEVCGHTRWKYDKKSTIKEFNKYQMSRRRMY